MSESEKPKSADCEVHFIEEKDGPKRLILFAFVSDLLSSLNGTSVFLFDNGIQFVLPQYLSNVRAVIEKHKEAAPKRVSMICFEETIDVPKTISPESITGMIALLELCPSDVHYSCISTSEKTNRLIFSGPKDREADFVGLQFKEIVKAVSHLS